VYAGPPAFAQPYFTSLTFALPRHLSPPDFVLDAVSGLLPRSNGAGVSAIQLADEWADHISVVATLTEPERWAYRRLQAAVLQRETLLSTRAS
ncbi:hypothetical protein OFN55_32470, partial [Escherichia coli]|nr:hypothetical protein [Escherichia coli]